MMAVRGCYLVRSPCGISPQHPRGTTWYARTREGAPGKRARREGAASGDPRVRFDRGLFDRFLRASAIMVMDEREPILRGAKAPAHAQSQSYDMSDPRRSRRRTRLARRGHRTRPEFQSPRVPRQRGAARGDRPRRRRRVGRRPVRRERRLIGRAERERGGEGKGARVTATDTRFREVFSRSFAEASNEAFVETIAAASAAGRRDNSRSPSRTRPRPRPRSGHPVRPRARCASPSATDPAECSPRRCSACSTARMQYIHPRQLPHDHPGGPAGRR